MNAGSAQSTVSDFGDLSHVVGLSRSDAGAETLTRVGAEHHFGRVPAFPVGDREGQGRYALPRRWRGRCRLMSSIENSGEYAGKFAFLNHDGPLKNGIASNRQKSCTKIFDLANGI